MPNVAETIIAPGHIFAYGGETDGATLVPVTPELIGKALEMSHYCGWDTFTAYCGVLLRDVDDTPTPVVVPLTLTLTTGHTSDDYRWSQYHLIDPEGTEWAEVRTTVDLRA